MKGNGIAVLQVWIACGAVRYINFEGVKENNFDFVPIMQNPIFIVEIYE